MASHQTSNIPVTSGWWRHWQHLKGMRPGTLSIPDADLRGKWIIITGGNSGIGREAALKFAKWGANIILGCRQPPPHEPHPDAVVEELKTLALAAGHENSRFEWWECDMGSLKSVEAFGNRWLAQGRPLDILCNNAGTGGSEKNKDMRTGDGFQIIHQVNFISHVLLTLVLLPSLARAPAPRIVCTTSCEQYYGTFDLSNANAGGILEAYSNNKLYFQTWLTELQARMSRHHTYEHIVIHGLHPGFVASNIWVEARTDFTPGGLILRLFDLALSYWAVDSQQGSLAILLTATSPEWDLKSGRNGAGMAGARYCSRIWEEVPMPQTLNSECRRQVWDFVCGELKLKERDGLLTGLES